MNVPTVRLRALVALVALLFLLLPAPAPAAAPRPAAHAHVTKPNRVSRPNLDIYAYRRAYVPGEKVQVRLSAYNIPSAQFTAYKMDLPGVVKNSAGLTGFGKTLKALSLAGLPVAASWRFPVGRTYPDQWAERAVTLPHLAPGVYLIAARAPGVEKRTWLDITDVALLAKRSRQETLVSATDAGSGRPLPGLALTVFDGRGARGKVTTDADGVCRFPSPSPDAVWVYGQRGGSPAFALAALPPAPDPYSVYPVTDRPIYRPGQTVEFKAVIRTRTPAPVPGGVALQPLANKPVVVEVRDATDALLSRQTVTTNGMGSLAGSFPLASEPTLGHWQTVVVLGEHRYYGAFDVEAYRKPEMTVGVTFGAAHFLGGAKVPVDIAARYFFGQPVPNAPVAYHIEFDGPDAESAFDGQGATDAQGRLHLEVATQRRTADRTLSVRATVTDLSRRSQAGSGDTLVAAGLFRLSLETDKSVYRTGERVLVTVRSVDYDGRPAPARVRVRLIETKFDRLHRPYEAVTAHDVQTNALGVGMAAFASPRPGDLRLEAQAFDAQDNKIAAESSVWVAGEDEADDADYPTLALVAGKTEYAPGETATILLNTSLVRRPARAATKSAPAQAARPDAYALVTVEGERLGRHLRVHLTQRSTLIRLPLSDRDFPSVSVNAAIVQDHQVYEQQARLSVLRKEQKLSVSVASDKARYQPGETARYTVTTRDYLGRPVPAELSLGVVDASIYALAPDAAPDPESVFYPGQEVRVQTEFSFAAQYSGGAFQTVPKPAVASLPPGAPTPNIRVRRRFADTAYWNPFVVTDADGAARVSLALPDNLTTWRATARGVTARTAVGSATAEAVSAMPLLVRLALPRFYVQGDQAVVSAIVQNYTGAARTVHVTLQAFGATLAGDPARTVTLAAGGQERLDWRATVGSRPPAPNSGGVGEEPPPSPAPPPSTVAGGAVRFTVTADGGAGAQDATETTLPAAPPGLKMVTATAATLAEMAASDKMDLSGLPPGATVTLTLSPSLASSLFPALDFLTSYPYGCAEQTMSSFLPDVAVAQALGQRGAGRLPPATLNRQVNLGLQTLYRYQHADGGWNWWEFDQTDGDMTAYVLSGLIAARRAGYLVDDQRILRGAESLKRLLAGERELSRRADWLLALSDADPKAAAKPLDELFGKRGRLDAYGQASLCLALAQTGGPARAAMAQAIARSLEARAVVRGRLAFWTDEEGGYSWRDDNAAVTAHVLRALLSVHSQTPVLPSAVRWLMADRQGNAWGTTRTTAEVVLALAKYLGTTGELAPSFTAHVALDGAPVKEMAATAATVYDDPATLTLTPAQLAGHASLTVDKSGAGTLYLSRVVAYTLPPAQATPQSHGLSVRRVYRVSAEDPSQADIQPSGSEMDVSVEIVADAAYRYVQLEDPIPAGCEVAPAANDDGSYPLDSSEGAAGYSRQEVRDDRVVFFFDSLPKGRTRLTYRLRAETPGAYQVLPGLASLTYFPEIRGSSGLVRAKIGERNRERP